LLGRLLGRSQDGDPINLQLRTIQYSITLGISTMLADQLLAQSKELVENKKTMELQEGVSVTIRPVQPDDIPLIMQMHQRISPNSLYLRYLSLNIPSIQDLEFQCSLNGSVGMGIVAIVGEAQQQVIALACCLVDPNDPTRGEPAILVEDRYQGCGLGTQMLNYFYTIASQMGLETIVCHSDPSNFAVLKLIKSSGLRYQTKYIDGLREITIWMD
jgi:GNAT superfamily N-acetyltransferase